MAARVAAAAEESAQAPLVGRMDCKEPGNAWMCASAGAMRFPWLVLYSRGVESVVQARDEETIMSAILSPPPLGADVLIEITSDKQMLSEVIQRDGPAGVLYYGDEADAHLDLNRLRRLASSRPQFRVARVNLARNPEVGRAVFGREFPDAFEPFVQFFRGFGNAAGEGVDRDEWDLARAADAFLAQKPCDELSDPAALEVLFNTTSNYTVVGVFADGDSEASAAFDASMHALRVLDFSCAKLVSGDGWGEFKPGSVYTVQPALYRSDYERAVRRYGGAIHADAIIEFALAREITTVHVVESERSRRILMRRPLVVVAGDFATAGSAANSTRKWRDFLMRIVVAFAQQVGGGSEGAPKKGLPYVALVRPDELKTIPGFESVAATDGMPRIVGIRKGSMVFMYPSNAESGSGKSVFSFLSKVLGSDDTPVEYRMVPAKDEL